MERECSRVVAHSLLHAFCSPLKIPDATATSLIHPWDTSGTQNSETTIQQTSACPRPRPNNGNTVRTAICWNRMPPTPLSEPLWNFQQSTHGRALPQRLHDKGTPDRGMEHKDHSLTLSPFDAIRPRWLNHTQPHIKPLQEQNLLDQLTTAAFEIKVPHAKPLDDRNHCQGEPLTPPPPHSWSHPDQRACHTSCRLTCPHIKPLQKQDQPYSTTSDAYETKVPQANSWNRKHCQGEPLNPPPPQTWNKADQSACPVTRRLDHTFPHIKPLQKQYQPDQPTTGAHETKVPHANPLDRNHSQGKPLNPLTSQSWYQSDQPACPFEKRNTNPTTKQIATGTTTTNAQTKPTLPPFYQNLLNTHQQPNQTPPLLHPKLNQNENLTRKQLTDPGPTATNNTTTTPLTSPMIPSFYQKLLNQLPTSKTTISTQLHSCIQVTCKKTNWTPPQ